MEFYTLLLDLHRSQKQSPMSSARLSVGFFRGWICATKDLACQLYAFSTERTLLNAARNENM